MKISYMATIMKSHVWGMLKLGFQKGRFRLNCLRTQVELLNATGVLSHVERVELCFVVFCRVLLCFVSVLSCFVAFCNVLSCFVMFCHVLSWFLVFCRVVSCLLMFNIPDICCLCSNTIYFCALYTSGHSDSACFTALSTTTYTNVCFTVFMPASLRPQRTKDGHVGTHGNGKLAGQKGA